MDITQGRRAQLIGQVVQGYMEKLSKHQAGSKPQSEPASRFLYGPCLEVWPDNLLSKMD